ncbi:MAG: hypothetical protein JO107_08340, partial [Hyphomicrobiales bacterium]|nr:hypothetical protein [Hyphomicrobiales bacterium]MBV8663098.1 hypothetical protein [Hyphomicrobiales bacterium]
MKCTMVINMDGKAFDAVPGAEVSRILRAAADCFARGEVPIDPTGRVVANFRIKDSQGER